MPDTITLCEKALRNSLPRFETLCKTYYSGCRDETGQTIAVNTEKEIDCVVKRCVPENGKNILQIVSGGKSAP